MRRRSARFTFKRAALLAAALGLLGAILAGVALRPSASASVVGAFAYFLFVWGLFLSLATPLMTTLAATHMTTRLLRSEDFELVYVTALSNQQMVGGQVVAVLHRMRAYLIVQASLLPLLAIGSYWMLLSMKSALWSTGSASLRVTVRAMPATPGWDLALPMVLAVSALFMLWNMNLLAASAGVRIVLLREAPLWAGPSAVVFITGLTLCLCVLPALVLDAIGPFERYSVLQIVLVLLGGAVLVVGPALLALADTRWTAYRWLR